MRKRLWIEGQLHFGWGCSECEWMFVPPGPAIGNLLDQMKQHYEQQGESEKDFVAHVCAEYPRSRTRRRSNSA